MQSGYGDRYRFGRHHATVLLTGKQSNGALDMFIVQAPKDAEMPTLAHDKTHITLFVLDGVLQVTLDGQVHELSSGDLANIPANTPYATRVLSSSARWVSSGGNGNGGAVWADIGTATDLAHYHASGSDEKCEPSGAVDFRICEFEPS